MSRRDDLRAILTKFQEQTINFATGRQDVSYEQWEESRGEVLAQPELLRRIPDWVASCRWGSQFWSFIKAQSSTYQGRRKFIRASLDPVFAFIERGETELSAASIEPLLGKVSSAAVGEAWARAQSRRETDPEGVITAARSLLESTCKYILDELGEKYKDSDDLPQLYRGAASALNLSPASHTEQIFKQILSGCFSVVNGMAALRNEYGDAHGKGTKAVKPTTRHADLALNLAGSIAAFLINTYEARKQK